MKIGERRTDNFGNLLDIDDYVLITGSDLSVTKEAKIFTEKGYEPYGELQITLIPEYGVTGIIGSHRINFTREFVKYKS